MTAQFIVLLTEDKDASRGELKFLAAPADVAHYIEVLLEGGYARENIRVFQGREIELAISYRPVVSLAATDEGHSGPEPEESHGGAEPENGDVPDGATSEEDEAQGVRNGVRFSELFRPS